MWGLLVMYNPTQRLFCKEKSNLKRRKKLFSWVSCQTERRGKQKSSIVLDGRQRESIFLFHDLSALQRVPAMTTHTAGAPIIAHAPLVPSAENLELFYGNPISDPRIQSPSL